MDTVIIGGSFAGLLLGLGLAQRGQTVAIIERRGSGPGQSPFVMSGGLTSHRLQPHTFLEPVVRLLRRLRVLDEVVAAGGRVTSDAERYGVEDSGRRFDRLSARRGLVESILVKAVMEHRRAELIFDADVPPVTVRRLNEGSPVTVNRTRCLKARSVVVATGGARRNLVGHELAESAVQCGQVFVSQWFSGPTSTSLQVPPYALAAGYVLVPALADAGFRAVSAMFPEAVWKAVDFRPESTVVRLCAEHPTVGKFIEGATPIGRPVVSKHRISYWREPVGTTRSIPVLGGAGSSVGPLCGAGLALAAIECSVLLSLAASDSDYPGNLQEYWTIRNNLLKSWVLNQLSYDALAVSELCEGRSGADSELATLRTRALSCPLAAEQLLNHTHIASSRVV